MSLIILLLLFFNLTFLYFLDNAKIRIITLRISHIVKVRLDACLKFLDQHSPWCNTSTGFIFILDRLSKDYMWILTTICTLFTP